MLSTLVKLVIVAVALVSSAAWAGPMAMTVGQTAFFRFPSKGSQVEVSDASVAEVQASKGGAELKAKRPGTIRVTLRLRDGDTQQFTVLVTSEGAKVYSVAREEPAPAHKART